MRPVTEMREHQIKDALFMAENPRSALLADVGTGKTVTTLTHLASMLKAGYMKRVLIAAPLNIARTVWLSEPGEWEHTAHLKPVFAGGTAPARKAVIDAGHAITTIGVNNLVWLIDEYGLKGWPFDTVVLDESHLFGTTTSKRWKSLRFLARTQSKRRAGGFNAVPSPIKRMVQLTGTPAASSIANIYPQSVLLDNGERLGRSKASFEEEFFHIPPRMRQNQWAKPVPNKGATEEIASRVSDIMRVRRLADCVGIPSLSELDVAVTLPATVLRDYKKIAKDLVLMLKDGESISAPSTGVLTNKLQQFASGAVYIDGEQQGLDGERVWTTTHRAKVEATRDLADSIDAPVLIWTYFRHSRVRLMNEFPEAVSMSEVEDVPGTIAKWNKGYIKRLILNVSSHSAGLNLQFGGHHAIYFDIPWPLVLYLQSTGRLHRSGQKNPVFNHRLIATGTLDKRIAERLRSREDTQTSFLDSLEELN